jgi:hypothetical protein
MQARKLLLNLQKARFELPDHVNPPLLSYTRGYEVPDGMRPGFDGGFTRYYFTVRFKIYTTLARNYPFQNSAKVKIINQL